MNYEVVKLDGKDFIVIDTLNLNNNYYMYVICEEDGDDSISIVRKSIVNYVPMVESVTDEEELEMVFAELAKAC